MGKSYKLDKQISVNMLSLTLVLVKSKSQNYLAQKMRICILVLLIDIQNRCGANVCPSESKQVSSPCCSFLQNLFPVS